MMSPVTGKASLRSIEHIILWMRRSWCRKASRLGMMRGRCVYSHGSRFIAFNHQNLRAHQRRHALVKRQYPQAR